LQGFPRDYQWIGTKLAIARQIGNAVPIPLGAALGRHLIAELDESTKGQLASGSVAHAETA
jgi:DNA (cytosine-5)-methyltransferase 1